MDVCIFKQVVDIGLLPLCQPLDIQRGSSSCELFWCCFERLPVVVRYSHFGVFGHIDISVEVGELVGAAVVNMAERLLLSAHANFTCIYVAFSERSHTNSRSPKASGAFPLPTPLLTPGGNTRYGFPSARRSCHDLAACTFWDKASRHASTTLPVHMVASECDRQEHRMCAEGECVCLPLVTCRWCLGAISSCFVMTHNHGSTR